MGVPWECALYVALYCNDIVALEQAEVGYFEVYFLHTRHVLRFREV